MINYIIKTKGFTLVELMITIGILSILAAIGLPMYNGYVTEAQLSTARANMDSLRIFLEDYRLDNGGYTGVSTPLTQSSSSDQINNTFGWSPDGDNDAYTYTLQLTNNSYNVTAQIADTWVRCEDRMSDCCDSTTSGASNTSCP